MQSWAKAVHSVGFDPYMPEPNEKIKENKIDKLPSQDFPGAPEILEVEGIALMQDVFFLGGGRS